MNKYAQKLIEHNIPIIYSEIKENKTYDKEIKKFITEGKSIYMYGETGRGKTYFLYRALQKTIELATERMSFPNMSFFLKNTAAEFSVMIKVSGYKEVRELINDYKNIRYLFLDDLGTEKMNDNVYEVFYTILNHRYEHNKSTFITSNFSLNDIKAKIDERISDRIFEKYQVIKVDGKNYRE